MSKATPQPANETPTIAIVGCGRIARVHAANLAPLARLAFASRNPDSARMLARRYGAETLGGLDEALERPDIAAVAICSPLEHHATQTVAALRAGKTVLVEKPLAQSRDELESVARALVGRPPGVLTVAENYLYKPSLGLLRRWLPALGPLRRVRVVKMTRQQPSGWRTRHGALLEGGIHFVALLSALVGEEAAAVRAEFPGFPDPEAPERRALVEVDYPSGARGEVRYAWDAHSLPGGVLQHSVIEGAHGRIVFESNGLYVGCRAGGLVRFRCGPLTDLMGFQALARDFVRSVRDPERTPRSDFGTARRDLEVVFRAYESRFPVGVEP